MSKFRILVAALLMLGGMSAARAGVLTPILFGNHAAAVGGFALVAHGAAGASPAGGSGTATVSGLSDAAANLGIIGVSVYTLGTLPGTVSDSRGNTWTKLTSTATTSAQYAALYYSYPMTGGTGHSFSFVVSGGYVSLAVATFSGAGTSPLDKQNAGSAMSSTTVQPGTTGTLSVGNELLVTVFGIGQTSTTSISSPYTITDTVNYLLNNYEGVSLAYDIQAATTASNPTWTAPSAIGGDLVSVIGTFKP